MKFPALVALLASTALGMPAALETRTWTGDGLTVRNVGYQGDGLYLATFDKRGVAEVKFTPARDLNLTARGALDDSAVELLARDQLERRNGVTCSGKSGDTSVMDPANRQLASNADAHGVYLNNSWGWVFSGNYVSYFCVYLQQKLSYNTIIGFHTEVSNTCGQSGYGFERKNNQRPGDLAVGRTFNGDHFCTGSFTGH